MSAEDLSVDPSGVLFFEFCRRLKGLSEEEFLLLCWEPFLLQVPVEPTSLTPTPDIKETQRLPRLPVSDQTIEVSPEDIASMERVKTDKVMLHRLTARDGGSAVVVGRSPKCDVVIKSAWVSKQHARFQHRLGQWQIVDLGSPNGTFLDKDKLPQDLPMPVKNKQTISFASYRALFLMPEQVHALGIRLLRSMKV